MCFSKPIFPSVNGPEGTLAHPGAFKAFIHARVSWQTKEEVASTLEAVQSIQTTTQALHKSKEIYNTKTVEQERLRKEGATQRDVDKVCGPGKRGEGSPGGPAVC